MNRRVAFWSAFGSIALVVLAAAWFITNFERQSYEVRGDFKREALRNPFLAAERLLRALGYRVDTAQEAAYLEQLPANGVLILSGDRQYHLTPGRTRALFDWVESGGYLIADAGWVSPSDPIIHRFDVRFRPPEPASKSAQKEDTNDDETDSSQDDSARRRTAREPPRRTVSIPGYSRDLRMRAVQQRQLYVGAVSPAWSVQGVADKKGNQGMELLEFRLGKGSVALINGLWRFNNWSIEQDSHAELLAALLLTHHPQGEVRIMTHLNVPSIWEWLSEHATAALAAALVLLAAWLWHIIPRFGVVRPDALPERRSLIEHLRAIGRFLWRQHSLDVLLEAARGNLRAYLVLRFSAQPLHADLARRSGLGIDEIALALTGAPKSPAQYTAALRTLRELEQRLR
jgi:hypothetical protein